MTIMRNVKINDRKKGNEDQREQIGIQRKNGSQREGIGGEERDKVNKREQEERGTQSGIRPSY